MSHRSKLLRVLLALCLAFVSISAANADTLSYPYSFSPSTPARSSEVNSNFSAISTVVNGNIDNNNIKSGASISLVKLNLTQELPILRSAASRVFSAGTTGDSEYRAVITSDGYLELGAGSGTPRDLTLRRKSSSVFQFMNQGASANRAVEASSFQATTFGEANPKAALDTTGIVFGAGGASATDVLIKRPSAGVTSFRNAADNADTDVTFGNVAISGVVTGNAIAQIRPGGRLTLTSNTPVTTGDVSSAGTLYYTPYVSNLLPAYSSSSTKYTLRTFSQLSLSLTLTSGTNYDVWSRYNSGNFALSVTAWTNDTTRATALARSSTSGMLYKNADEEYLYLGTIRASGSNITEDSAAKRYVWNMYNRVEKYLDCKDGTDSWSYTTAAYQEARAQSTEGTSRVGVVRGLDEDVLNLQNSTAASSTSGSIYSGIGIDSSTVNSAYTSQLYAGAGVLGHQITTWSGYPGIGYHTGRRLEYGASGGTWYGDGGTPSVLQSGMRGHQLM